jgi:MoaA/NifB/PqqE/SkfB family radical SAM enzyme
MFGRLAKLLAKITGALGSTPAVKPRWIRIEASSFCQLRCPSCPTASGHIQPVVGSGFLTLDNFRKLLESAPDLERVELSNYGEALLNPQLLQILQYAHSRNFVISLENGVNLNNVREEVLEGLVRYSVSVLTCSIDGATPESYRRYRVGGDFQTVISNIEKINRYKLHHGSEHPHLQWQFVVFGHNEKEIPAAREMARELGMDFRPKLTWDSRFSPIEDAEFVRSQTGWQSLTRHEYEREHGEKFASSICHQLWENPQINWDGKILGCCRNFWGDFGGNAFIDGLAAGVNSQRMVYARAMLTGKKPSRSDIPCATCEIYLTRLQSGNLVVAESFLSASATA